MNNQRGNFKPKFIYLIILLTSLVFFSAFLVKSYKKAIFNLSVENKLASLVKKDVAYLDTNLILGSSFRRKVYAAAKIDDDYFALLQIVSAKLENGQFTGEVVLRFPNGDLYSGNLNDYFKDLVLRDGTKSKAQIVVPALTLAELSNGKVVPIQITNGSIENGRIKGIFSGYFLNSGYQLAGIIELGRVTNGYINTNPVYVASIIRVFGYLVTYEEEPSFIKGEVLNYQTDKVGKKIEDERVVTYDNKVGVGEVESKSSGNLSQAFNFEGIIVRPDFEKGIYQVSGIEEGVGLSVKLVQDVVGDLVKEMNFQFKPSDLGRLITSQDILDLTIGELDIAYGAITSSKIKDGAISSSKIENGAISESKLSDGAVTSNKISDGTISTSDLASTLTFSNGDFIDLSYITYESSIPQGLRLPNILSGSPVSPSSGEGYLAWDSLNNNLLIFDGSSWANIGSSISLYTGSDSTSTTSSSSGLELINSDKLSLIRGCSDGQVLKWNGVTFSWDCEDDVGASSSGISKIKEGGTLVVNSALEINFDSDDFVVTNLGSGEGGIEIDYTSSYIVRSNLNESIIGVWDFVNGLSLSSGDLNLGSNDITVGGVTISSSELSLLDGRGGTLLDTNNVASQLSSWDQDFSDDLTTSNYSIILDSVYVNVGESPSSGDISGSFSGGLTINANSVALGVDTTGDYVATITAGAGLTGDATGEGSTPTLAVASANGGIVVNSDNIALTLISGGDGLSSTTSSASGLEILSSGLTLIQGCSNNQILKWNETTDVWYCADDVTGGSVNSFETINAPSGTNPVADSSTDTLNLSVTGTNLTITGDSGTDTLTFDISESTLAGDGLGVSGDSLTVNLGSGIQIVSDALALGTLTADWDQTGAFDIILNNSSSELKILESGASPTFYGTIDIGDLTSDSTYTFSGSSGTVLTSANYSSSLDSIYVNVGESPSSGDISGSFSGGLTINANSVALGVDTTGDYVSGATANYGLVATGTEELTLGIFLQSNKGLEVDSNGLSLIDCGNGEILKYSTSTNQWSCQSDETGSQDLDNVYDNDTDKVLAIDNTSGLTFNMTSGDFIIQAGGSNIVTFDDLSGVTTFTDDIDMNFGVGENLNITAVSAPSVDILAVSNSGQGTTTSGVDGLSIDFTAASDGAADTNAGLHITITDSGDSGDTISGVQITAGTASAGTQYGLRVDSITGGAGTEYAISIGSGWDAAMDAGGLPILNIGASGTDFSSTGGLTLADGLTVTSGGASITAGGLTITAGALAVNSDSITSDGTLTINAANTVFLGDGTNGLQVDETWGANSGWRGNARPTRRIVFAPEYLGAVLTGDGSNNNGTMTSDNDGGTPPRNYYNWTVTGGTSNDYDIWVKIPIPSDFSEFTSSDALTIEGWTSSTTNTALEVVQVYDNSGTGRCAAAVNFEPGSNNTWADKTTDQTCTDTGVASPNDIWTVRIRLTSSNSANARVGRFYIQYYARF